MIRRVRLGYRFGGALGLAATLGIVGCGDGAGRTDEAIVVPSEPLPAGGSTSTAAAPTGGSAPAAATPTTPAEPAAGAAEGWGTLKGRVVLVGDAPEPQVIDTSTKDPEVCAKEPVTSEKLVVDPSSKGVKYALVYIPKPTRTSPEVVSAAQQTEVVFDQKNCVFEPHVLAVMKGATIELKSSDPVNHNINAKLRANAAYNTIITPNQPPVDFEPLAAERSPAQVVCDIHPWMQAFWLITDSPYFAVTDEQGNFEIANVPAGSQKVVAWQEAAGYLTASSGDAVAIKADDTTTQEFKLDAAKVK